MKLDVAVNDVVLSNVGTTGEFKIRNSAKAFKILSDGLYSNKIKAIIRELSCNAVDSHVAAGKPDVPFEVHLPTMLEPWFSVRDFGTGLDNNQVVNIYTTYFESTKSDSNDFIGALGLGSKSPFSYTENFTVTAIKDGTKRIYSAFINEVGVPSIAEMSEELTDEGNGVEVKFSVTDRYDYNSFVHEAQRVFMWFKHRPNVIGNTSYHLQEPTYREKDIVPGIHYAEGYSSIAVMGNIAYEIKPSEPAKYFGDLAHLLSCGLVIEFDIGDLDFAASREELSYVPLTINSIKRRLEELNANLAIHLAEKADALANEWERASYLGAQYQTKLYKAAVRKYVTDTKFALFDVASYHGRFEFEFPVSDLLARQLEVKAFQSHGGRGTSQLKPHSKYVGNNYVYYNTFPVDANAVFVLNDLKTGCFARARYHFSQENTGKTVYCLSHTDPDLEVRQAEYDKFMAELHNPPVIMKASELIKQERKKSVSTQGILTTRRKISRGRTEEYCWEPYSEELDDNITYYYVALSNYEARNERNEVIDVMSLRQMMNKCGIDEISKIQIFGVRKNRLKELSELDNWVPLEDKLKAEIAKVDDKKIASLVVAEMVDSYYNRTYSNKNVAKLVGKDSLYYEFIDNFVNVPRTNGEVTQLVALCQLYCKSIQVEDVKKKFTDAKEALYKRYPLLTHLFHADDKDVADYIKLVDKQEKT